MIKLKEAQKIGSTYKDSAGRTVASSKVIFKDLFVNPEHIVSINEQYDSDSEERLTRLETTKGSFTVLGSPTEIEKLIMSKPAKQKVLKD
jgi:hypothetical protein